MLLNNKKIILSFIFFFKFQEAVRLLGGIDVLVLNHIMPFPLGEWLGSHDNLTQFSKIMDINFRAYVHLASHAQRHLEASRGSIVVVSSYAGEAMKCLEIHGGARCSSVVRAFAHGAMDRRIDPSWWSEM